CEASLRVKSEKSATPLTEFTVSVPPKALPAELLLGAIVTLPEKLVVATHGRTHARPPGLCSRTPSEALRSGNSDTGWNRPTRDGLGQRARFRRTLPILSLHQETLVTPAAATLCKTRRDLVARLGCGLRV